MNKIRTQPVLLGGLVIGVLSALPVISIANCCCLWIAGGGAVAAYLGQQQAADRFSVGDGALYGALAGLVGACVWLLVWTPIHLILSPLQARISRSSWHRPATSPSRCGCGPKGCASGPSR